jgi:hypothetical protein
MVSRVNEGACGSKGVKKDATLTLTMKLVALQDDPDSLSVLRSWWCQAVGNLRYYIVFWTNFINICLVLTVVTLKQGQLSHILRNIENIKV